MVSHMYKIIIVGFVAFIAVVVVISRCRTPMDVDVVRDRFSGEKGHVKDGIHGDVNKQTPRREGMGELYQLDPVKINFTRELTISPNRTVRIRTLATKPPLFEIWDLFSHTDCDHLIHLAEKKGLTASQTLGETSFNKKYGVYAEDGVTLSYNVTEWQERFNRSDLNRDGVIDSEELHGCLPGWKGQNVHLTFPQVQRLILDLKMDGNSNGVLDLNEFWVMHNRNISEQVQDWLNRLETGELDLDEKPKVRHRISDQAWLDWATSEDTLLKHIPLRLATLTGLHKHIIQSSEHIQVARYYPGGHYYSHFDSQSFDPNTPCYHTAMKLVGPSAALHVPRPRSCRFITIMTYLNDVEEGGETAFPIADNKTYNLKDFDRQKYKFVDLTNHCHEANLLVRPEKGKSVMWYNHHVDPMTGWLGKIHNYAVHGGCDVIRGTKWIANNWINVDNVYEKHLQLIDAYFPPSTTGDKTSEQEIIMALSSTTNGHADNGLLGLSQTRLDSDSPSEKSQLGKGESDDINEEL